MSISIHILPPGTGGGAEETGWLPPAAAQTAAALGLTRAHGRLILVAIGASTGGPAALNVLLKGLPGNFPSSASSQLTIPPPFVLFYAACSPPWERRRRKRPWPKRDWHGGRVTADSTGIAGEGATFTVRVPLGQAE